MWVLSQKRRGPRVIFFAAILSYLLSGAYFVVDCYFISTKFDIIAQRAVLFVFSGTGWWLSGAILVANVR